MKPVPVGDRTVAATGFTGYVRHTLTGVTYRVRRSSDPAVLHVTPVTGPPAERTFGRARLIDVPVPETHEMPKKPAPAAAKKSTAKPAAKAPAKTAPKGSAAKSRKQQDEDDEDEDEDEAPAPKKTAAKTTTKKAAPVEDDEDEDDLEDEDEDEDDEDDEDEDDDDLDDDDDDDDDDEEEEEVAVAPAKGKPAATKPAAAPAASFPEAGDESTTLLRNIEKLMTEMVRHQQSILTVLTQGAKAVSTAAPVASAKVAAEPVKEAPAAKKASKETWEPVVKASDLVVGDVVRVSFADEDEPRECTVAKVGRKVVTITTTDDDGDEAEAEVNPVEEEVTVRRGVKK